ncbi:MAG TPA: phosphodiester glycosidase family protein [Anaerolineales bacterium]|nr:phosphodiester glycosidase family protein [Anaerolineales bacterium]
MPTTQDTGWLVLQAGMEKRIINLSAGQNQLLESIHIIRLDQKLFRFDVAYDDDAKNLADWQAATQADIVVNGGFFRVEYEKHIPNGLTIINGQALGESYDTFAGMLSINEKQAELSWLANQPYNPKEKLVAGLQSFPILVKPGGVIGFSKEHEDNLMARRTVIGQDKDGNILFIVASQEYFTLHKISAYLTESDLNLDIAINLDGGPSSGMYLNDYPTESVLAQTPLPIVILAYSR